jgi:hypothetical protein
LHSVPRDNQQQAIDSILGAHHRHCRAKSTDNIDVPLIELYPRVASSTGGIGTLTERERH